MNDEIFRIARSIGQLHTMSPKLAEMEEAMRLEREHAEAMVALKKGHRPRPQDAPSRSMGEFRPTDAIASATYGRLLAAINAFDPANTPRSKKVFQSELESLGCDTREQEVFARIVSEHFGHDWRN